MARAVGYKVRLASTGFQILRPVTLKNRSRSSILELDLETHFITVVIFISLVSVTLGNRLMSNILELDLETHLVHKRGEYHQASFDSFKLKT